MKFFLLWEKLVWFQIHTYFFSQSEPVKIFDRWQSCASSKSNSFSQIKLYATRSLFFAQSVHITLVLPQAAQLSIQFSLWKIYNAAPSWGPWLRTHCEGQREKKKFQRPAGIEPMTSGVWVCSHVLYHCATTAAFLYSGVNLWWNCLKSLPQSTFKFLKNIVSSFSSRQSEKSSQRCSESIHYCDRSLLDRRMSTGKMDEDWAVSHFIEIYPGKKARTGKSFPDCVCPKPEPKPNN